MGRAGPDHGVIHGAGRARPGALHGEAPEAGVIACGAGLADGPADRQPDRHGTDVRAAAARDPAGPGRSALCLARTAIPAAAAAHPVARRIAAALGPAARHGAPGAGESPACRDPDGSLAEPSARP